MSDDDFLRDLEARMGARDRASRRSAAWERALAEAASARFEARVQAGVGRVVEVQLVSGRRKEGHLVAGGPGWLALRAGSLPEALGDVEHLALPGVWVASVEHVESVVGLPGSYTGTVEPSRIGRSLSAVLRAVSRSSHRIVWCSTSGSRRLGRVRVVGLDHVVLHQAGVDRVVRLATLSAFEVVR